MAYKTEIANLISANETAIQALQTTRQSLDQALTSLQKYNELLNSTCEYTAPTNQVVTVRSLIVPKATAAALALSTFKSDVDVLTVPSLDSYWPSNIVDSSGLTNP